MQLRPDLVDVTKTMITVRIICYVTLVAATTFTLLGYLYNKLRAKAGSLSEAELGIGDVPPLRLFLVIQVCLMLLCYAFLFWWRDTPHQGFPYITPYLPFFHFWDLIVYSHRIPYLHTTQFFQPDIAFPWQYPPSVIFFYAPFLLLPYPAVAFFAVVAPLCCLLAFEFARSLQREGMRTVSSYTFIIACLVFSYPLWTEMLLANSEIFIFFFVVFGLLLWFRQQSYWAAIFFGLATGLKIFPGVYFALMLKRKQYKEIAVGLATAAVSNIAGLWVLCPNTKFAWHEVQAGLAYNRVHYMLTWLPEETSIDHSLLGLIKSGLRLRIGRTMPPKLFLVYMLIVATFGLAVYFLRINRMPILNQVAALSVAAILLPPTSHDYTLIHLFIPFSILAVLAVRAQLQGVRVPGLSAMMFCLAICMAAESELIVHHVEISAQLKCSVLFVFLYLILRHPWPDLTLRKTALAQSES